MELWELNTYLTAYGDKRKYDTAYCILTGYYAAYYTNGGKKAKSPNEIIQTLYSKKQTIDDGLKAIEKIKAREQQKELDHG